MKFFLPYIFEKNNKINQCLHCEQLKLFFSVIYLQFVWKMCWKKFTTILSAKLLLSMDMESFPNTQQLDTDLCLQLLIKNKQTLLKRVWVHGSVLMEILKARTKTPILLSLKLPLVAFYIQSGGMFDTPTSLASRKKLLRYYDNKQLRWKGRKKGQT